MPYHPGVVSIGGQLLGGGIESAAQALGDTLKEHKLELKRDKGLAGAAVALAKHSPEFQAFLGQDAATFESAHNHKEQIQLASAFSASLNVKQQAAQTDAAVAGAEYSREGTKGAKQTNEQRATAWKDTEEYQRIKASYEGLEGMMAPGELDRLAGSRAPHADPAIRPAPYGQKEAEEQARANAYNQLARDQLKQSAAELGVRREEMLARGKARPLSPEQKAAFKARAAKDLADVMKDTGMTTEDTQFANLEASSEDAIAEQQKLVTKLEGFKAGKHTSHGFLNLTNVENDLAMQTKILEGMTAEHKQRFGQEVKKARSAARKARLGELMGDSPAGTKRYRYNPDADDSDEVE
jgi:hypothetical protein